MNAGNGEGLYCFFEDDGDTGYFYFYEPAGAGIIDHLHIYDYPKNLGIKKKDVKVIWSKNHSKCGVKIWGSFYGIFDFASSQKISHLTKNQNTLPIQNPSLLAAFRICRVLSSEDS